MKVHMDIKKIFVLLILSFQPFSALAQEVPADWEFVILKTAHFDIVVNARQQDLGQLYAQKLESAYSFLNPLFTDKPERTVVIINDNTDVTNGYATPIPYSHIMAYPVLPGPSESLSENGDWALELLTHEYTHILTFQPATGFIKYLHYVFGTVVSPNLLLPRWWKEGLAVHIESQVSRGGRMRSLYQDAMIRSFSQAGTLSSYSIDQVNEILPSWPEGQRPYLFGALMWSQMVADKGDAVIDQLHQRQGGRVPYFIEQPARDLLGQTYVAEYNSTLLETDRRAKAQVAQLQKTPTTDLELMDLKSHYLNHPAISPNGRFMAVIAVSEIGKREIKLLERKPDQTFNQSGDFKKIESYNEEEKPPTPQDGPPTGSIQRVSWFHHSPKLVFDKIDSINRLERYSDLHIYDLKTQKSEPLTTGLRGREPSVAPNDGEIAYVHLEGGKTALALYNISTKTSQVLWAPVLQSRLSYPTFIDNDRIVFALRDPVGQEGLWIFDRRTHQVDKILSTFKDARFPQWSARGLFFTSSENGVHNIYLADASLKTAHPVSHLVTAAFSSTLDPLNGDLYLTTMTEKGPQVGRLSQAQWKAVPTPLPKVGRLFDDRYPVTEKALAIENSPLQNPVEAKEDYHSGSYLWPHYWVPYLFTSTIDNSLVVQASTGGFDPLKKHVYSLTGSYETGLRRASVLGSYQNNQTDWPILLQGSQINSYFYSSDYLLTTQTNSLSVWPDLWKVSRYLLWEVGGKTERSEFFSRTPERQGVFTRLIYSNFTKAGVQISPESGQSAYLGATNYFYNTDDLYHTQYVFGASYYHSKWLPPRHAIMLKVNGFYVNEELYPAFGAASSAFTPAQDLSVPVYLLRGYGTGQFFGRKLYNFNAEYRLPLRDIYRGFGTDPYFFHRFYAALVADGLAVDGYGYNIKDSAFERLSTSRTMWSGGAELRLETTLGYVLPINFVAGYYAGQNGDFSRNGVLAFSIQAGTAL
jgi:hypothetical protein